MNRTLNKLILFWMTIVFLTSSLFSQNNKRSIEIIKEKFLSSSFSENDISDYEFFLANSEIDLEKEAQFLLKINDSLYKNYFSSFVHKRKGEFSKQFNLLFNLLQHKPSNINYYEELIFAARINNNIDTLKNNVDTKSLNVDHNFNLYLLALSNYSKGNFSKALLDFEKLCNGENIYPEFYFWKSYTERNLGNYDKAFNTLETAKKSVKKNSPFYIKIMVAQGSLLFLSNKYDEAKKYYDYGLSEAEKISYNTEKIKALTNLAIILDVEGDVDKARSYFSKAINIANQINSFELLAFANSELGVSYSFTNELIKAKEHYKRSFSLYNRLNDFSRLSYLSYNLGNIYLNIAKYRNALDYYQRGLEFSKENVRAKIQNLTGIADSYSNLANYSKSLEYYQKAKELSLKIKDVSSLVNIELGLGILHYNLGRSNKAIQFFSNAKDSLHMLQNPFVKAQVQHKLGLAYLSLDSLKIAEEYLNESVGTSKNNDDVYLELEASTDLAYLFFLKKNFSESEKILKNIIRKSLQEEYDVLTAAQKILLSKVYRENRDNVDSSIKLLKEAAALGKSTNNIDVHIESNFLLAKAYEELDKFQESEYHYNKSIKFVENFSRPIVKESDVQISFFSNYIDIYNSFAEFYLNRNMLKEAFEIVDMSRSRNTLSNINNIKISYALENNKDYYLLYDLDWMINSGIYSDMELDSLKSEYQKIKEHIIAQNSELKRYFDFENGSTVTDIQNKLDAQENLISIYTGESFVQYFIIGKDKFVSDRIDVSRDSLINVIKKISPYYDTDLLINEMYFDHELFAFNAEASYELYNLIFKDILKNFSKDDNLVFSLPNELVILPLELLVEDFTERDSPYNYDRKKFIIYNHEISYTPSLSIYLEQRQKTLMPSDVTLLIGDPSMNANTDFFSFRRGLLEIDDVRAIRLSLLPLEYSKEEIEQIDDILDKENIFLSERATETNFKKHADNKSIIHISTHTFQYKDQPLLVFSDIDDLSNDGILEAGEIVELNLNSEMVVLSSCRSGLGEIDEAEGIIGLQKAFYDAGAKSLVVSLWDVSDKFTSKFMQEFYLNLSKGFSKSKALRLAKIEFIKKYSSNPYYWSAFVLSGNTDSINLKLSSSSFLTYAIILFPFIIVFILTYFLALKKK